MTLNDEPDGLTELIPRPSIRREPMPYDPVVTGLLVTVLGLCGVTALAAFALAMAVLR